jgi:putative glycosyltransferase (TIGR04372 family)
MLNIYTHLINAFNTWRIRKHTVAEICRELLFQMMAIVCFCLAYVVLTLIRPYKEVRIGFLEAGPLGHLALNLDLFFRRKQLGLFPKNAFYVFFVYNAANRQLLKMYSRRVKIYESKFIGRLFSLFAILNTKYFQRLDMNSNEYAEYQTTHCELSFTEAEQSQGRLSLSRMGIGDSDWFVCIFARDALHYKKVYGHVKSSMAFRDSDIDTYSDAAKFIVEKGGFVLRMGMNVEKPFSFQHERVIEYSQYHRSDFMDVYLTATCKMYIGTASGGSDMARIFDKFHLALNWTLIGWAPGGKNEIYLPKTLCHKSTGRQFSYADALSLTAKWIISLDFDVQRALDKIGAELISNSPQEILAATKELMERVDGKYIETEQYRTKVAVYFELRHRYNNWCKDVYTPIAANYLESLNI